MSPLISAPRLLDFRGRDIETYLRKGNGRMRHEDEKSREMAEFEALTFSSQSANGLDSPAPLGLAYTFFFLFFLFLHSLGRLFIYFGCSGQPFPQRHGTRGR